MSIDVSILGSASGRPAPDRHGQTVVVSSVSATRKKHFIFDTGDGASSLFIGSGLDHNDLEAIFISHMHADHHGGFAQMIKTCGHLQRERPLTVLAPAEGIAPLQAYLTASYLVEPFLRYEIIWVPLADHVGREIKLPGEASLSLHPNDHMAGYRRRLAGDTRNLPYTFESYSAAITIDDRRVVYSGNLRRTSLDDDFANFVAPCDLYIGELAHIDPADLGAFSADERIKHTVVTHYHSKWYDVPHERIKELILAGAQGSDLERRLTLARDGTKIKLG